MGQKYQLSQGLCHRRSQEKLSLSPRAVAAWFLLLSQGEKGSSEGIFLVQGRNNSETTIFSKPGCFSERDSRLLLSMPIPLEVEDGFKEWEKGSGGS